ncbi:MAG: tetratricopeptide repeat protein [Myxococcota bacterium]
MLRDLRFRRSEAIRAVLAAALLLGTAGCASTLEREAEAERNAKRANSHFNIAVDHQENGRVELALRELLTAYRLEPENPKILHALGITYLQKGKEEEAERYMKQALAVRPDYQEARYNLSTLYMRQGRNEDCIAQSRILYDDPTFTQPWRALTNWGWCSHQQGELEEARRRLELALDYNARYWPTLLNLGILEAEQRNKMEAIGYFERVLALEPDASTTAEANYRLGEIFVSIGKREQALEVLKTAVVKAPSDPWGKKSEEYLKLLR